MSVFSAPGKALLAGGYLVLDPLYNSYVTALSSRMHAVVEPIASASNTIKIKSPQFHQGEWEYHVADSYVALEESNGRRNPFVEATISTVLSYVRPTEAYGIEITVYSDPGYHSQEGAVARTSTNGNKTFLYHSRAINDVAKTGLGSSAGLVSVVTAGLLSYFGVDVLRERNIVHNAAQIAHCYAQRKIGSGFDVAAAVYGSIGYKRFDPSIIDGLFQHAIFQQDTEESRIDYHNALASVVNADWPFNHDACALPPRIRLLMGDIEGGSETPKLVSKVLQWKKDSPAESSVLYRDLNQANEDLITSLGQLHEYYRQDAVAYERGIEVLASTGLGGARLAELAPFYKLADAIGDIRTNLQKLTQLSGADIEPPSQTELLDNCTRLNGCVGGVVPGAGGYDAVCLLVVDSAIEGLVTSTAADDKFSNVTWLNLHEQSEGLVAENVADYSGFD